MYQNGAQAQTYWNGTQDTVFVGTGTQSDPFLISSAEELAGLAYRTNVRKEDFAGQYFRLTQDVYLTDFSNPDTSSWLEWEPIAHSHMQWGHETDNGYFRGSFDGQNHTVYNMYYGRGMNWADDWDPNDWDIEISEYDFSVMNKALFVNLDGGTIENLRVENAKMAGVGQALLVLNTGVGSVVRGCHVQGALRGSQGSMSGLVGNNKGLIENCSVSITAEPIGCAAFVSTNDSTGVIRNCTAAGSLYCTKGNGAGFAGTNNGLIEYCSADVTIRAMGGGDVGTNAVGGHTFRYRSGAGFVMNNGGTIRACGATGDLMAEGTSVNYVWSSAIAGFAYSNDNGVIESSWCSGTLRDVSDSTASGDCATMIQFVYMNGESASHSGDGNYAGTCVNCFSASNVVTKADESQWRNAVHGFLCTYNNGSGFDCEYAPLSQQISCYFNEDGLPVTTSQLGGGWQGQGVSLSYMKSQAFVDSLNLVAQFMGTNLWQYNAGALPTPTTTLAPQSATAFLAGGDGSKANPYLIGTKQQLMNVGWLVEHGYDFRGEYLKQTADIALNLPFEQWEYEMPTQWKPIGTTARASSRFSRTYPTAFYGNYDGDWHEVQNMYIDNIELYQGLFGMVGDHVTFRNLGVTGAYIRAASFGILGGQMGYGGCETGGVNVIQCWMSGDAQTQGSNQDASGAFIASKPEDGLYLNCSSSAVLTGGNGYWSMGALDGRTRDGFATDTLLNFLMTGSINNSYNPNHSIYQQMYMKTPTNHCHYNENAFFDNEVQILSENPPTDGQPMAWLQSKECVNIYNQSVSEWNAAHGEDLQLNYWQWRENDYPQVSHDAAYKPSIVISFNSNGGTAVLPKYLFAESKAIAPARPQKDSCLFAGWYSNQALTQFFDWENTVISESMTLYAKWVTDTREEYDFTPFNNTFTSTYHIRTAAQLRAFAALQNGQYDWYDSGFCTFGNPVQTRAPRDFTGKTIVLDNDIFLNDTTDWQHWGHDGYAVPWKPIGQYSVSVPGNPQDDVEFKGTFNGQGHVIYGLYIEMKAVPSVDNYYGLFGALASGAVVKNVGIEASVIDGVNHVNLREKGVTYKGEAIVPGCASSYDLMTAGLLVGTATGASVEQCYAVGKIIVPSNFYANNAGIGGLVGEFNTWGSNYGTMSNSYARVDVEVRNDADKRSFGLIGAFMRQVTITNCYAAGRTYAGLMPYSSEYMGSRYYAYNSLTSSYFNKELVVDNTMSAGAGKLTDEMHMKATFADWDFTAIWGRKDSINGAYPYLRVFRPGIPDDEDPTAVTGIEFTENSTNATTPIEMVSGDRRQLHAHVLPYDAGNQTIIWTSSDTTVAKVDANGVVTAINGGGNASSVGGKTATITATTEWGSYSLTCKIKVFTARIAANWKNIRRVGETEWTYNSSAALSVNMQTLIEAYCLPYDSLYSHLTFESSNPEVADIQLMAHDTTTYSYATQRNMPASYAIITGKQAGQTTFTIRGDKGIPYSFTWTFKEVEATSFTLAAAKTTITQGESMPIQVKLTPATASYMPTLAWSSSNPNVLAVSADGVVTGVSAGTATITATAVLAGNTRTATIQLTVRVIDVTHIYISPSSLSLYEGQTGQLTAEVSPSNATNKSVTWSTSDPTVATVDSTGLVTAVGGGSYSRRCTITATSSNGISDYVNVTVNATRISISYSGWDHYLYETQTRKIPYTLTPADAQVEYITWSIYTTGGEAWASVDENGVVTAISSNNSSQQSVTIRATLPNGNYASTNVYIRRSVRVTDVVLTPDSVTMRWNESQLLTATFTPAGVTNPQMFWESSDTLVVRVEPDETDVKSATVYGVAPGEAVVTGYSQDGHFAAECYVRILDYGTDIESADALETQPRKVVRDGRLYILLPNGVVFDATGRRVE